MCGIGAPVSVHCSFRSLLPLPMYPFTRPLSLACMLLRLFGSLRIRFGHPESRAVLATFQGWNRVRAADLFEPTPPHNFVIPYELETKNKQQQQQQHSIILIICTFGNGNIIII